ncbi:MAG: hypothetical protein ACXVEE_40325 [Polyangiales bacterium]
MPDPPGKRPPPSPSAPGGVITTDLAAEDISEDDLIATGQTGHPTEEKKHESPKGPPPRTRPPAPPPRGSATSSPSISAVSLPSSPNASASSSSSTSTPKALPRPSVPPPIVKTPAPVRVSPPPAVAKKPAPEKPPAEKTPRPQSIPPPIPKKEPSGSSSARNSGFEHPNRKVEINIAPSESMAKAAEHPLATQPGSTSMQALRARQSASEVGAHVIALRQKALTSDKPRLARLLVEEALAWERAGDLTRAGALYREGLEQGVALLPAARGARRVTRDDTLPRRLALLDREGEITTKESDRADLLVEKARLLEAARRDDEEIANAYRRALALRPQHAEALKGLEGALLRARAKAKGDARKTIDGALAEHLAKLAAAYGGDPELVATYHSARARLLEERDDLVAAEEAWAAALGADGRVGPVREAYKRLLAKRGAYAKLRDVLAEEAGREHDLARSVRLLMEAARISIDRLNDPAQAIGLLEHAASRAPTDPAVDARVLEELVRLYEDRGDAKHAAQSRRLLLEYETDPVQRAIGFRRLGHDLESIKDFDSATASLEHALALEPLHVPTQLALDRLYKDHDRNEQRLRLWLDEAAKAREPGRRAAAYVRAAHVAEDALGRPDEALEYLRAAWVTDTGNVDALDELTRLLLPPNEVRHGIGGGEGRSARALIELFTQASQVAREPARKIAYLEKVAALWEDALGNPLESANVYRKILALEPTRRFALLALQRACERSGDFKGLAQAIETEADQASDKAHGNALRLRAADVWGARANDPERAIALVKRVLDDAPADPIALRALLAAQEAASRSDEVGKTLQKMIEISKPAEAVPLWIELAELRKRRLGKVEDAIAAWRSAIAIEPTHPVATRELAQALRARAEHQAVAELEEKIAAATKDANAAARSWLSAAEIWESRLGNDEKAQAAYARALGTRVTDLSAWDGLARIAERRGAYRDLEQAYRLRIEREEVESGFKLQLRIALAELLARRVLAADGDGDEKAASVALEAVVAEAPAHLSTLRLLEAVYRKTGNEIALARTLTALAQAVRDPLAKRGVLWDLVRLQERTDEGVAASPPIAAYLLVFELDQTDEAALSAIVRHAGDRLRDGTSEDGMPNVRGLLAFGLRKQIALAPDAITMAFLELRLADLLEDSIDKREIADALKLYRGALARDPESPTAVAGVRRVGALLGDLSAQLAAERAGADIALDRQAKVAHLLRAAELSRRVPAPDGGDEVAIELVVRALREDPDSAEAAAAASALFLGRGDARRLVDVLMEAAGTAKRPDRIVALAREGAHHASTSLDNVPVAIALLTQAREADPHDATLLTELGDLYVQQRAWSEAASSYSESVKNAQNAPTVAIRAHRALAQLYEGPLEDPKAALAELRLVCKLAPDDVDAQRRLAGVLEAQGDRDGALRALEALVASPNLSARERIDCFSRISDIKAAKGDLRGAEHALRLGLLLDTDPAHEPFARLAAFHARHGGDTALAGALVELVAEKSADPRWVRILGEIEMHRIGKPTEGLAHLRQAVQVAADAARTGDPRADVGAAQLAFSEGLLAVGAHDDAVRTAREVLARDPSSAGALSAAGRALSALGRRDEALVCEEVRAYFGYEGNPQTYRARRLHPTPPRTQALEDVAIHAHVMPNAAKTTAYEVIHALADQLGKVLPPDLSAVGVTSRDKLGPRSTHPLRLMLDRAAHALGVTDVDLYVHDAPDQRMVVENTEPPAVLVPSSLQSLPELEIAFAVGKLVAKVATRTYLVDKLHPNDLEDLLYAAVDPLGGPSPRVRIDDVADMSRKVQKAISRKARRQLEEIAPRYQAVDAARFARAIDQGAIRTAYLLTGDLTTALDHLRRYDEKVLSDLAAEGNPIGDLLRFALGSDAPALRRRLGTTWG